MNTAVGAGEISFEYKGILDGKYTEGIIAALNRDEASFKLKTQRVIITSLVVIKGQKKLFSVKILKENLQILIILLFLPI